MGVRVREASLAEADKIVNVLYESFVEHKSSYTTQAFDATVPPSNIIRDRLQEGPVWVAIENDEIVGTASAVRKGTGLLVRSMAIIPNSRGKGIGEALLRQAEDFAIENHLDHLLLSTTPFLSSAIRLYERWGFRRTSDGPHDRFGTPIFTMKKILAK